MHRQLRLCLFRRVLATSVVITLALQPRQQLTVSVSPETAVGRTAHSHSELPIAGLADGRPVSSLIFRFYCTCPSDEPAVAYSGCELVPELGITAVADTARELCQLYLFYVRSYHSVVSARHDERWDPFLGSATSGLTSDTSSSLLESRATSVDTAVSRALITIPSDTDTNSYSTVETPSSPALSVPTTVESTMSPSYVTDRQLLQMAISQLMWTFGVLSTHVRHTQPGDVSDSMGRHLIQSQGHWLIPIPNAMSMSLPELIALLRPIWSQLYYTRR